MWHKKRATLDKQLHDAAADAAPSVNTPTARGHHAITNYIPTHTKPKTVNPYVKHLFPYHEVVKPDKAGQTK